MSGLQSGLEGGGGSGSGGGGGTTDAYIDERPTSLGAASAHDIDFATQEPSDSGYTYSVTPSGTPDIYTVNVTTPKVAWEGALREGHGAVQPVDATVFIAGKTGLTLDTQSWYWFRNLMITNNRTVPTATDATYSILVLADAGLTNNVAIYGGPALNGSAFIGLKQKTTAGVPAAATGLVFSPYAPAVDEMFIQKNGTSYFFWVRTASGWHYIGTETHATTFTVIRLLWFDDGGAPGTSIHYPKFFRYGSGLLAAPP